MTTQNINIDIPVTNLTNIWKGEFKKLPANKIFELIVDYPLDNDAKFQIRTGKSGMGLVKLLQEIGKAYSHVYNNEEKYGVYGHDIYDLALEGIRVDMKKQTIKLDVGS